MVKGLSNNYVEKTGFKLLQTFLGCYPSDLQPKSKKSTFSVIFNLSKHNEPGTHFVAIYSTKDKIIYFDSLGAPCTNKLIKKLLEAARKRKKIYLQQNKSTE